MYSGGKEKQQSHGDDSVKLPAEKIGIFDGGALSACRWKPSPKFDDQRCRSVEAIDGEATIDEQLCDRHTVGTAQIEQVPAAFERTAPVANCGDTDVGVARGNELLRGLLITVRFVVGSAHCRRNIPRAVYRRLNLWGRKKWLEIESRADVDIGKGVEQAEDVEEPQNHGDNYHCIQDGLDCALHGDEAVDQPE